jgi:hypothetical protein
VKVYTVTQINDEGEWTGTSVYDTARDAAAHVNFFIDEHNEDEEEKVNRIIWDEKRGDWRYTLGSYTYHFQIHELGE